MVPKICCLSRLNRWRNLLDPVRKRETMIQMKVNRNKGICLEFVRNVLDGCRYDNDYLQLGYMTMKLLTRHLQDLPCLILVLLRLEFIIRLIEGACPSLFLPNLDPLLCKFSRPSVKFTRDLKPSYMRNDHHFGKSHIIYR